MNRSVITGLMGLVAAAALALAGPEADIVDRAPDDPLQALCFTMDRLDGAPEPLETYRGKVMLIVNTASKCGLTPQYEGLQELYETYQDRGFVVLGFPANNFGNQEPGSDSEIESFCRQNYGVTFPMFSKISVKGENQHPLYHKLTAMPAPIGGEVQWNFQKYLVGRDGRVVAKFDPRVTPSDPKITNQIEALLQSPAD